MFNQYFGSYLLNHGIITPDKLKQALDLCESTHVKLGVLAMNANLMNASQVAEVQNLQKSMDKKFGEIAVMKGYLTESQVQELLKEQRSGHMVLSQVLVDRGFLSLEQLEEALKGYREQSGFTPEQLQAIEAGDIDNLVKAFLAGADDPYGLIVQSFLALLLKNMVRFLNQTPRIDRPLDQPALDVHILVSQHIKGELTLSTALAMDDAMFFEVARRYSGMHIENETELAEASVTEFLNLNNGLFIVNMDNAGVSLSLEPPLVTRNIRLKKKPAFMVPCYLDLGTLYIVVDSDSLL